MRNTKKTNKLFMFFVTVQLLLVPHDNSLQRVLLRFFVLEVSNLNNLNNLKLQIQLSWVQR